MKKTILLLSLLFLGLHAHSQVLISLIFGDQLNSEGLEFGLDGGFNLSSISSLDSANNIAPFNIGFYFDIKVKDQWSFYTGVLVKAELGVDELSPEDLDFLNARIYDDPGTYSQRIRYFLLPALMKYTFSNHVYVEGGTIFGLMYNAWIEYETDTDGFESTVKQFNEGDINPLEAGASFGVGYRLKGKGWSFGLRLYHGFTNVYKNRSGNNNRALFFKVNVPIGAAKSKKKEEEENKQNE